MRLSIKLDKYKDYLNDKKNHMFEIAVDNGSSEFKALDVTNIEGVGLLLADINIIKQAIEDYLCANT
jgi:hypothetical protein